MVPGQWLIEGGRSAAGAAIEALLAHHPYAAKIAPGAQGLPAFLADRAMTAAGGASASGLLARGLHVVPELIGNRAPHADPDTRAVVAGLGMGQGEDSLVALHIAGLCGIGYGLRQIIEAQRHAGVDVERVVISGGAGNSALVRRILADTTGWKLRFQDL